MLRALRADRNLSFLRNELSLENLSSLVKNEQRPEILKKIPFFDLNHFNYNLYVYNLFDSNNTFAKTQIKSKFYNRNL